MLNEIEKTAALMRIALISARRIRARRVSELTNMEYEIHEKLRLLGIVGENTKEGRVGDILISET